MIEEGSLIVVHFVEQQLEGWTFARGHWPLHITLVPWFETDDEEAIIRSLERVAAQTAPLTLRVGKQEMFGVNNDVPVNVIRNQVSIRKLHDDLLTALNEADTDFHEQRFVDDEYIAHIPRHEVDGRFSNRGEGILVNNYRLVRLMKAKKCRVEQEFNFG